MRLCEAVVLFRTGRAIIRLKPSTRKGHDEALSAWLLPSLPSAPLEALTVVDGHPDRRDIVQDGAHPRRCAATCSPPFTSATTTSKPEADLKRLRRRLADDLHEARVRSCRARSPLSRSPSPTTRSPRASAHLSRRRTRASAPASWCGRLPTLSPESESPQIRAPQPGHPATPECCSVTMMLVTPAISAMAIDAAQVSQQGRSTPGSAAITRIAAAQPVSCAIRVHERRTRAAVGAGFTASARGRPRRAPTRAARPRLARGHRQRGARRGRGCARCQGRGSRIP